MKKKTKKGMGFCTVGFVSTSIKGAFEAMVIFSELP